MNHAIVPTREPLRRTRQTKAAFGEATSFVEVSRENKQSKLASPPAVDLPNQDATLNGYGGNRPVEGVSQAAESEPLRFPWICAIRVPAHTGDRLAFRNSYSCVRRGLRMGGFYCDCRKLVHQVSLPALREPFLCRLEVVGYNTFTRRCLHCKLPLNATVNVSNRST